MFKYAKWNPSPTPSDVIGPLHSELNSLCCLSSKQMPNTQRELTRGQWHSVDFLLQVFLRFTLEDSWVLLPQVKASLKPVWSCYPWDNRAYPTSTFSTTLDKSTRHESYSEWPWMLEPSFPLRPPIFFWSSSLHIMKREAIAPAAHLIQDPIHWRR